MLKSGKTKCPSASVLMSIALGHPVKSAQQSHVGQCEACKREVERLGTQIKMLRTATWTNES